MARPALGRGLGSLIPQKQTITEQVIPEARQEILNVPVENISINPRQPRVDFSPASLEDLINSIKEHGILQPLIVTRSNNGFELIAGERRYRAAKTLGLETVPAIVRDSTEQEKLELALIENIQRQDLNSIEEALAYKALMEEFNLSVDEISNRVGKARPTVSNTIRLLDLPEDILMAVREGRITKTAARTLLSETNPDRQRELFDAILKGGVTIREAEARIENPKGAFHQKTKGKDPNIVAHEKNLREILGTKVNIHEKDGKGRITIQFYSKEDLGNILDLLSGE